MQTNGVGKILTELAGAEVSWIHCKLRLRGWKRAMTRLRVGWTSEAGAIRLARKLYPGLELPAGLGPDMVVSSCGSSAYLNRLLCKALKAKGVFIGEIKPFPPGWFDLIITPVETGAPNELLIPLIETGRSDRDAEESKNRYWNGNPPTSCWSLLVGGPSRTHAYVDRDWVNLAHGVNNLSRKFGVRWLISTSRRTGGEAEALLKLHLDPDAVEEAVWWSENPKKVVGAFIGAGERVFVTQDSNTMVSESLSALKPTVLLCPENWTLPADSFNGRYLARLAAANMFARINLKDLADYEPAGNDVAPIPGMRAEFSRKLLSWAAEGKMIQ